MPRIRSNNNISSAAAVVDTAAVATQRGPLHMASQGPLSPAVMGVFDTSSAAAARRTVAVSDTAAAAAMGVFDTSIAARAQSQAAAVSDTASVARRQVTVTVTDTVAVAPRPCLKKALKYTARRPSKAHVQSTLRKVDREDDKNVNVFEAVERGLLHMEKHNKKVFDKVMKVYRMSNRRKPLEDALVKYACGRAQEFMDLWKVCWANYNNKEASREQRREQVKAHYEDLETVLAEVDDSTPKVSFGHFSKKEYVLTEWERVHIKLGEASRKLQLLYELPWVPHTKYDSFAPVPSQAIKRGANSAHVKDHMDLDDYSKRQLLLATRDWLRHGNIAALELAKQPLTKAPAVVDTATLRRQSTVVSDTTAATQSTTSTMAMAPVTVSDTATASASASAVPSTLRQSSAAAAAVSDTATASSAARRTVQSSTPSMNDVVDTLSMAASRTAAPAVVVTDTTTATAPLRRSARIAARRPPILRRTTRLGAVKPKGFYKV